MPGTSVCTDDKPGIFPDYTNEERERVSPANGVMGHNRAPRGAYAVPKLTGRAGTDRHHPAQHIWAAKRLVGHPR